MTLHADEFEIDDALVHRLLATQAPQWADRPLRRLDTDGTVNVVYRLGTDMVVRLPRAPHLTAGPEREARWMPIFAASLPLRVPSHLFLGQPSEPYPSHWSILEWIDGTTADVSSLPDLGDAARALGEFVLALRRVPTDDAPEGGNYRGFGLAAVDESFRTWVDRLPADLDRAAVRRKWEWCRGADAWSGSPTWFHTDLRGDNLIARDGRLVAVIDWEGCTVGDPCADYLAAWWLFDADSRPIFRAACRAGDADWRRAKGWALHMAVTAIGYYGETNPGFVTQARRALAEILG